MRSNNIYRIVLCFALLVSVCPLVSVCQLVGVSSAETGADVLLEPVLSGNGASVVDVGVAGVWKPGIWTPIVLPEYLVPGELDRWTIEAVDDDGLTVSYPAFGRVGRFRIGSAHGAVTLKGLKKPVAPSVAYNGSLTIPLSSPANSHQKNYLVLGTEAQAEFVRRSVARTDREKKTRPLVVRLDSPDSLYGDYLSLQVVDQIIWFQQASRSSAPSITLLDQWVRSGGNLIVALGAQAPPESQTSPLPDSSSDVSSRAPVEGRLANTTALEEFAGSEIPIPRLGLGKKYAIPVQTLTPPSDALVLCRYLDLPLIYRYIDGFGQKTILAFDLGHESILKWSNRDKLLRRVLDIPEKIQETETFSTNAILHYGYDDLPGQLASALDQYSNVPCASFWSVAGALLIYILLIGAGDYFLWRRLGWPVQLSWGSFPVYILLFCVLFYCWSIHAKGERVLANSAAVCDIDLASGSGRVFFYGAVFVPKADRYSIQPQFDGTPFDWTGWFGSTGQGISGMNYPARFTARSNDSYALLSTPDRASGKTLKSPSDNFEQAEFNGIPLAAGMSRNLVAGTFQNQTGTKSSAPESSASESSASESSADRLGIRVSLFDDLGKPRGELENRSDKVWENSLLVYGDWAFPLGKLEPGQKITIDDSLERFSLDAVLVGKRVNLTDVDIADKYSNESQPYNPTDQDIDNIVRTALFYDASGGVSYTKLENGYQSPTDFSSVIKTNRAVLLVRETSEYKSSPTDKQSAANGKTADLKEDAPSRFTGIRVQQEFFPSNWVFRRFLIPVASYKDKLPDA